jgi:uncharacterized protein DUF6893
MLLTLVKLAVVIAVVTVVVESLPDIKRYLKIRDMLALATPGRM